MRASFSSAKGRPKSFRDQAGRSMLGNLQIFHWWKARPVDPSTMAAQPMATPTQSSTEIFSFASMS